MHNSSSVPSMNILKERIDKWLSSIYWTDVNIHSALQPKRTIFPSCVEIYAAEGTSRPLFEEVRNELGVWEKQKPEEVVGKSFGPSWRTFWFRLSFPSIPRSGEDVSGRYDYYFSWDSNSEALLYLSDGTALQAYTGGGGPDRRDRCCITNEIERKDGSELVFYVEMACNEMFGTGTGMMIAPNNPNRHFTLERCEIVEVDREANALYWDMKCAYDLIQELPEEDPTSSRAISTLNEIINKVRLHDDDSIAWARQKYKTT